MGFKDLRVLNDALLGKQAWRLVEHPESLMGRVKYYPNITFLNVTLGSAGSCSWSSIWSAKDLVKEGVLWRIGNGKQVNIWSDPWVVGKEGRFITCPQIKGINKVCDFIDMTKMEWNVDLISLHFHERDQQHILAIPQSLHFSCPQIVGFGRERKGDVLFAATRQVRAWCPPKVAESKALLLAIKLAKNHGYHIIILESDNQVLVNRLSKAIIYFSDLDSDLEDILSLNCSFNSLV